MRRSALTAFALTLVATAACGTGDDQTWIDSDADTVAVEPTAEMRAQFMALRSEVDSVMGHLRSEVETRQQAASGDTLDAWTDTYASVAERRGDLLVKLDELGEASVDHAREIRNDVASELADLEADVVRQKLRLDSDEEASPAAMEEHLVRLERNLDEIESRARSIFGGMTTQQEVSMTQDTRAMTAAHGDTSRREGDAWMAWSDHDRGDHIPEMEELRSLREDIHAARRDAAELRLATRDELRDRMDDLSDQVADLTRDVRRHWYNVKHSFMGMHD